MNHVASTKDRTKLIISDDGICNALVFEYSNDGRILVSVAIPGKRKEQILYIDTTKAKSAIIDYMIDHIK